MYQPDLDVRNFKAARSKGCSHVTKPQETGISISVREITTATRIVPLIPNRCDLETGAAARRVTKLGGPVTNRDSVGGDSPAERGIIFVVGV
jgi:hypothetical protein